MRLATRPGRRSLSTALALLALVTSSARAQEDAEPASGPDSAPLVQANQRFALDLFRRLSAQEGNLCLSPHSISTALAMTYAGARGRTAEEIARVLHIEALGAAVHAEVAVLTGQLELPGGDAAPRIDLAFANRLWGDERESFRPAFLERLAARYEGGLERLDFAQAEVAAARINAWTARHTDDRIRELVRPDDVDGVAFVLTNAVAFQGAWRLPFDPERTAEADFHVAPERVKRVAMMTTSDQLGLARGPGFRALELPFDGDRLSMVFLLPDEVDGLAELERGLSRERLNAVLADLAPTIVAVWLPRFEVRARFELADTLYALGMPTAFGAQADFTGMIERPGVFIARVIHEAFVRVDEAGAEAAAATAVIGKRGGRPASFRADHPFLFLIRDRASGALLFLGRVVEP